MLRARNGKLSAQISAAFIALCQALQPYRTGSGPTDFESYSRVPLSQHRDLANLVLATAVPLSQVAAIIVAS